MAIKATPKKKKPLIATPRRKKTDPKPEDYTGVGQPTAYHPRYCTEIIDYFGNAEAWEINYSDKGSAQTIPQNKLPTAARFARAIGIDVSTLYKWVDRRPEFALAYANAMELQKTFIMEAGGVSINAAFAMFMLKCNHGMTDVVDTNKDDDGNVEMVIEGKGQGE